MVRALRAPVRPRVISPETGDPIVLEDVVQSLIESNAQGAIEILGGRGAGKTTALEHLAGTLASPDRVVLLDDPDVAEIDSPMPDVLVIFTSCTHCDALTDTSLVLAPWTDDDIIEYLLATHPAHCRSVMQRLQDDSFRRTVRGEPQLWRIILDELAHDEALPGIRDALRRGVGRWLGDRDTRRLMCDFCLAVLLDKEEAADCFQELVSTDCTPALLGIIRHRAVRLLFAADRMVEILRHGHRHEFPWSNCSRDLILETGHLARADRRTAKRLRRLLQGDSRSDASPVAASILHAAGAAWRPEPGSFLSGAYLSRVKWEGVDLSQADLSRARLNAADLPQANLHRADLSGCSLVRASLRGARLVSARLRRANVNGAVLANANAESADFHAAQLVRADLEQSALIKVKLSKANLTGARFCGADMSQAILNEAIIDDTDFTNANLCDATLIGLVLRKALVNGARFAGAELLKCDLEFMELPDADFTGADLSGSWLTGTVMPNANFQRARLCGAGLADVEWEGADLRDADLSDCSFHMGSSRSGLVGSPYPGHGSRTGFYTDTYDDRYHKSPEEIRKANLTGADLRGADVRDADFYLVDLRGALYDHAQAEHFRRCDAILDDFDQQ